MEYLEVYNPDDVYDDEVNVVEALEAPKAPKAPKRRRKRKAKETGLIKFEPSPMLIGGLIGVGYLVWCLINKVRTRAWSWTPWKSLLGRPHPRYRYLGRAFANTVPYTAGRITNPSSSTIIRPATSPSEETVSLISP